jgi:hypothetical protein
MGDESKTQSKSGYFWSSMTAAMNEKAWQMVMSLFGGQPQI